MDRCRVDQRRRTNDDAGTPQKPYYKMKKGERDENGQPVIRFPAALMQNYGKAIDQLVGLCRGILIDNHVSDQEAEVFRKWVEHYFQEEPTFPFDDLKRRLDRIFLDGVVDEDERIELREIMRSLGGLMVGENEVDSVAATLPLCHPAPLICHQGQEFVVTGRCAHGTRAKVWEAIQSQGGLIHETPRHTTRYLIIGHFASRDWIHTTYGRKIERAVELRAQGQQISIVSEAHWSSFL